MNTQNHIPFVAPCYPKPPSVRDECSHYQAEHHEYPDPADDTVRHHTVQVELATPEILPDYLAG